VLYLTYYLFFYISQTIKADKVNKKADIIVADKLLGGVCVFITNHIERQGRGLKVSPDKVIGAYRNKTKT